MKEEECDMPMHKTKIQNFSILDVLLKIKLDAVVAT